jgi:hypothetical protein
MAFPTPWAIDFGSFSFPFLTFGDISMRHSLLSALVAASVIVPTAHAGIVITEVMSSSGTNGTPDWFEVTNDGSSAVSLSGWKFDDGSFNLAAAVALSGITSIGAGESVIFIESAGGVGIGSFRTFWGGLTNVQSATTPAAGSASALAATAPACSTTSAST